VLHIVERQDWMNIPDKIKIGGFIYDVIVEAREEQHGVFDLGTCYPAKLKIWLEKNASHQLHEQTLLHEVIEAINKHNDLQLSHQTISTLGECLYQVLKDNGLMEKDK
jgi:hypothetical protein